VLSTMHASSQLSARSSVPSCERVARRHREHPLMMLFSSFGFNSPIVRDKFAKAIPVDEALPKKTCLIIPYAGFHAQHTGERETQGLVDFGFARDRILVSSDDDRWPVEAPDVIYVPGGDPFKLLRAVREKDLVSKIRESVLGRHAVYIGVSAGAYIAAESIRYVMRLEDNNEITDGFGALGLVPDNILCHYDHYGYPMLKECEEVGEKPIRTINDDQLLMFRNRRWQYIGED